jgi:transcription initiation factor TFIID subunit 1, fungi type
MICPLSARSNILPRIKKELERLEKNKARRQAREQQKELHQRAGNGTATGGGSGGGDAGSPQPGSGDKVIATGTTRKCANCGQVGHIKTNKKYECPCTLPTTSFSLPLVATRR